MKDKDWPDYLDDETRNAIERDDLSDEDFAAAERLGTLRQEEDERERDADPYSKDEKEQMGSSEYYFDND